MVYNKKNICFSQFHNWSVNHVSIRNCFDNQSSSKQWTINNFSKYISQQQEGVTHTPFLFYYCLFTPCFCQKRQRDLLFVLHIFWSINHVTHMAQWLLARETSEEGKAKKKVRTYEDKNAATFLPFRLLFILSCSESVFWRRSFHGFELRRKIEIQAEILLHQTWPWQ